MDRYRIPAGTYTQFEAFAHDLANTCDLATRGLVLASNDVELVLGGKGSAVTRDQSLIDELALHMAPLIYHLLGYLDADSGYSALTGIPANATLFRVIHNAPHGRHPVFAMNAVPVQFDGLWRDIDMSRPSSVCPTLELMGVAQGQHIEFKGETTPLSDLDLRNVAVQEYGRLSSIVELVFRNSNHDLGRNDTICDDPLLKRMKALATAYQDDLDALTATITAGRGLMALGVWLHRQVNGYDLVLGGLTPGAADRFAQSIGLPRSGIQLLLPSQYHIDRPNFALGPYFRTHAIVPFFIDCDPRFEEYVLNQAYQLLGGSFRPLELQSGGDAL
jgi:hypothetical protein